jgi:hypothetical protein
MKKSKTRPITEYIAIIQIPEPNVAVGARYCNLKRDLTFSLVNKSTKWSIADNITEVEATDEQLSELLKQSVFMTELAMVLESEFGREFLDAVWLQTNIEINNKLQNAKPSKRSH